MNSSYSQLRKTGKTRRPAPAPLLAGVAALLAIPSLSFATQYALEYEVDAKYRYNDNVGLRADDEVDVHGAELSLPAKLSLTDERYNAYVDGEVSSTKYDESGYNSDDQALKVGGDYKLERGSVNGNVGIDRNSTTETAFLDNGIVGASADRVERYFAGLNGMFYFSQENAFIAGLNYGEADYDTERLVDNQYTNAYAGLNHQYTERTTLRIQASASRFENDARVSIESDSLGLQLGFTTDFTETFTVSMLGGYSETDSEYSTPADVLPREDDDTSGWVLTTKAEYQGDRSSLEGSFVRRESASGDGYLIVSNQLNMLYKYTLSERTDLRFETIVGSNGALDDRIKNDRDYAEGNLRLTYRLTEAWYVSARYAHRYQDRERDTGDASGNLFLANISYRPSATTWSR